MNKIRIYDFWSIVLIGALTYLSFFYWHYNFSFFCEFYDIFYHLAISSSFLRAGGLVTQDFWSSFPYLTGFLYPPFFHILQYLLLLSGISKLTVANLTWAFYPISFITLWLFMRDCFTSRAGFYSVLLLSISSLWLEKMCGYPTNALLLILTILTLWALARQRYFISAILLFFCLITNVNGVFVLLASVIYLLHRPKGSKLLLLLFLLIFIAAIPLISITFLRMYHYHLKPIIKSFSFSLFGLWKLIDPRQNYGFLGLSSIAGIFLCYRLKSSYLILPTIFFANLPALLFKYDIRFWLNILLPFVMLSAVFLSRIQERIIKFRHGRTLSVLFFLFIMLSSNFLFTSWAPFPEKKRLFAFFALIPPKPWNKTQWPEIHQQKIELSEIIKNNCAADEAFFIDSNENAKNMLGALSGRSVTASVGARIVIVKKAIPELDFVKQVGFFSVYKETNEKKIKKLNLPKPAVSPGNIKVYFLILGLICLADIAGLSRWCNEKIC